MVAVLCVVAVVVADCVHLKSMHLGALTVACLWGLCWFLSAQGRMVVFTSGDGALDSPGLRLFHVKGTTPQNTRAVEGGFAAELSCNQVWFRQCVTAVVRAMRSSG